MSPFPLQQRNRGELLGGALLCSLALMFAYFCGSNEWAENISSSFWLASINRKQEIHFKDHRLRFGLF